MRLYLRAFSYFKPDLSLVLIWLSLIGLSTGLGLLTAWPMAVLIDSVLTASPKRDVMHNLFLAPLPSGQFGQIVGLAAIGLLFKLLADVLGVAQSAVSNKLNYNGLIRVRCDLYRKLQALNLTYHRNQPQGDAIYRLSTDTFGCQTILGVLVNTIVAAVTLVAMTVLLATRNLSLTLLAFSVVPVLAVANIYFGRRFRERTMECKEVDTRFTTAVQRSMACIGLVQSFGRESDEFSRFHGTVSQAVAAWWRLNRQQMAYTLATGATFGVGGAIVFGYGGYLVYRDQFLQSGNSNGMTVGSLMIFTAYLGMLWGPLCTLTGFVYNIQGGVAGAQRVFDVLDRDPVIADRPNAQSLPRQPRTLQLDGVSFAYDGGRQVLAGVSATINPGEMVAFVGPSGVGKSTLLNLFPRFYDPSGGAVRFDGIDARDVKIADLRKHVALVLQESVILPTTIAENIAYGRPTASADEIHQAARLAGAAGFIEELPDGYATRITEGGQNLSGGQRQRIAIARALLTEAPFIVLDEPTSALDPLHEAHVTRALRELKRQRTILIVSHRLSTVVDCDRILVMNAGRIVEQGTHQQLIALNGLYAQMAAQQFDAPSGPRLAA
ncbi:MAG TPA: ABC transporter ATP-binding protein [Tepidisphaeraceae bacterium]|jgi:ABC-type multidrug transport system fused ATPase/permease subunit|nr:ABC transporter ATP-binding protein [Tepidisphaeraceae bacterium]